MGNSGVLTGTKDGSPFKILFSWLVLAAGANASWAFRVDVKSEAAFAASVIAKSFTKGLPVEVELELELDVELLP